MIKAKTKGQYPAPLLALKAIREGANLALQDGLKVERKALTELVGSPVLANLIGIFFMKNRLSRDPGVNDPTVAARPVNHVGVLGDGLDGRGYRRGPRALGDPHGHGRCRRRPSCQGACSRRRRRPRPHQDRPGQRTRPGQHAGPAEYGHQSGDFRRLRHRHRGRHREGADQDRSLSQAGRCVARRRDPGQQHLDDLDFAAWPFRRPIPSDLSACISSIRSIAWSSSR